MSPKRKKMRRSPRINKNNLKRESDSTASASKRLKSVKNKDEEIQAQKRKNFVTACEQVSCKAYFDQRSRLLLVYLPACMKMSVCRHIDSNNNIKQMPPHAEESFKIEMKANVWYEALEVCHMCITPGQYLSADVLRDVVEIMLNAHEDDSTEYPVKHIIDKCQQVLAQSFSTHPPCFTKTLRKYYIDFLTTPMDLKEKTFTNRTQFECNKGIVKYCMNRLEYELSSKCKDGPLINKYENIPEEFKQSVKGLYWLKEKCEIYELLDRSERIERLMAVLESVVELLQFDLGIWHLRYANNLGNHVMRSHKPLMAYILWSTNKLYTGAVNNNCRQILRLFVYMVHLKYPNLYLKTITKWLNIMIQVFYICETNSNSDYPNIGKYCNAFANEFYRIISGMPHDSIIRILERIEPTFMQHLVCVLHIKTVLSISENDIFKIFINFVKRSQWGSFPTSEDTIKLSSRLFDKTAIGKLRLSSIIKKFISWSLSENVEDTEYRKIEDRIEKDISEHDINHIVHTLYVALHAYLDAYSVQYIQDTWEGLNQQLLETGEVQSQSFPPEHSAYSVSEKFIKNYRSMFQAMKELGEVLRESKNKKELPEVFNIFSNIGLLEL